MADAAGVAGVRPEAVHVTRERPPDGARSTAGIVQSLTYLGNCIHLEASDDNGARCMAELPQNGLHFEPGESVHLWWNACDELQVGL